MKSSSNQLYPAGKAESRWFEPSRGCLFIICEMLNRDLSESRLGQTKSKRDWITLYQNLVYLSVEMTLPLVLPDTVHRATVSRDRSAESGWTGRTGHTH
jgi:hypothetical protein